MSEEILDVMAKIQHCPPMATIICYTIGVQSGTQCGKHLPNATIKSKKNKKQTCWESIQQNMVSVYQVCATPKQMLV